ncbi:unnamed protein product [Medioppia subpectinata]|uniref:Uncharacterized protein n=1 Tax=Medioppia subpectinata TaxID=1979941 RepID=A0A7R9KSW5_9ACAR|nr:unnamed protein product [Medioppia subpectinata]CAG2109116.1 unnamed protein product [Medioppia subpectinata]
MERYKLVFKMSAFDECWLEINGVTTRVLQYGVDVSTKHVLTKCPIILMISGNPGEIAFYRQMLSRMHDRTRLPVLGLSHAGHNVVPKGLTLPGISGR